GRLDGDRSKAAAVPELAVEDGYAAWAHIYDQMPNALIRAEQPLVDEALDEVRAGRALDAACGTGRHAARLVARAITRWESTARRPCRPSPAAKSRKPISASRTC